MKCPYLKKSITREYEDDYGNFHSTTEENFNDCHGPGCPFYKNSGMGIEFCQKANKEKL
jgi:hypothetical protein